MHQVARVIVEDPPRSPRAVAPRLPEDLEIVLLKALEKDHPQRIREHLERVRRRP